MTMIKQYGNKTSNKIKYYNNLTLKISKNFKTIFKILIIIIKSIKIKLLNY